MIWRLFLIKFGVVYYNSHFAAINVDWQYEITEYDEVGYITVLRGVPVTG